MFARSSLAALVLVLSVAACSSDPADTAAQGGAGASGGAATGSSGAGSAAGGSDSGAGANAGGTTGGGGGGGTSGDGLKDEYTPFFPIGVALEPWDLQNLTALILPHFNHMTVGNAMKFGPIRPSEDGWNTTDADALVDFGVANGMGITCHTLVWHKQAPTWLFQGLTPGDSASIETLKTRLQAHVNGMVERYGDVCDNWDVVNEAISDDGNKTYRDAADGSKWYEIFGSEEYVYWAFRYTKDALEAREPGSSAGKLYYNDYNETQKADRILDMVAWLKDTHGLQIDGIGMQAHWRLDWPTVSEIETTIDEFVAAGLKVKISELDVTVYNDYPPPDYAFTPAPEVTLTPELEAIQAQRYEDLFTLFRAKAADITSVTVWGVSDDRSWLDYFPVTRNDHPLLFGDDHEPKAALEAIMEF